MKQAWLEMQGTDMTRAYPTIEWQFLPPRAPHMGGVYERLIQAAKRALYTAAPTDHPLSDEALETAVITVEHILNSRPLAYVSSDAADPLPLTPSHFLAGGSSIVILADMTEDKPSTAKAWFHLQKTLDSFWARFQTEVIPYLQAVSKWAKAGRDVQIGDIVALLDEHVRGRWPVARVIEVFPSRDGHIRQVKLTCNKKEYVRPIQKLMVLIEKSPDA